MQTVVAAIDQGAVPQLDPDVAVAIRAASPPTQGATWVLHLEFADGQRLKAWCDARRERAADQQPNDTWTRIVAAVNEVVQPFAPSTEPGSRREDGPRT